jgi:putative endonuclease
LGYRILARNVRCPGGELDLVAEDDGVLVFVEVRARRSGIFGGAAESIGTQKRRRTIQAAESYLQEHPADADRPSRIDVVAIRLGAGGQPIAVELIKNALEPR